MKKNFVFAVFAISAGILLASCVGKNALEGYEWIEGTWEAKDRGIRVVVEKNTYSVYGAYNFPWGENEPLKICKKNSIYDGIPVMGFGPIEIHERSRCLEFIETEYGGPILKKVSGPTILATKKKKYPLDGAKALVAALDKSGYVAFLGYNSTSYTVLHPFDYCKNSCRGIAYMVTYGEDIDGARYAPHLESYGEYEIMGGVLRVRDIQYKHGYGQRDPRVYDIEVRDGRLWLDGDRQEETVPGEIISYLELSDNCYHL